MIIGLSNDLTSYALRWLNFYFFNWNNCLVNFNSFLFHTFVNVLLPKLKWDLSLNSKFSLVKISIVSLLLTIKIVYELWILVQFPFLVHIRKRLIIFLTLPALNFGNEMPTETTRCYYTNIYSVYIYKVSYSVYIWPVPMTNLSK